MALIDERGRVFGRINLIDFALLAFVVVLLPLGYGAYLVFRAPPPQIRAVTPNPVTFKRGEQRVRVTGEYLRPFMKATLGQYDARAFLVEHATSAELIFVDLPVGTYDLALFDAAQEVARMPHALTVVPPPAPPVQVVGAFVGANAADAALTGGARFGDEKSGVEIITAGSLQSGERQATLRTACDSAAPSCTVDGKPIEVGKPIVLRNGAREYTFRVDDTRVDGVWADVEIRVFGIAEVLELLKPGDVDRHSEPDTANPAGVTRGAVVVALDKAQPTQGALTLNFSQALPDLGAFAGNTSAAGYVPLSARHATVRVPLQRTAAGWRYRDEFIRPGSALTLETPGYLVRGLILRVTMPTDASSERHDR
jgi:hypothetical protein